MHEYFIPALVWLKMEVQKLDAAESLYDMVQYTVECCYKEVQYNIAFHTWLWWLRQNIGDSLNPQKRPHTLP